MVIIFDIETTGLNPYTDQILTIQVKRGDEVNIWKLWEEENELKMIEKFLDYLKPITSSESIIGYNCLKFDVPFIVARLNKYGAMSADTHKLLHDKKWLDLYQFQGDDYVSMDRWLEAYDIVRNCPYVGRDVPRLFHEKKFRAIVEHAIDDLIVCEKLVECLSPQYSNVIPQ